MRLGPQRRLDSVAARVCSALLAAGRRGGELQLLGDLAVAQVGLRQHRRAAARRSRRRRRARRAPCVGVLAPVDAAAALGRRRGGRRRPRRARRAGKRHRRRRRGRGRGRSLRSAARRRRPCVCRGVEQAREHAIDPSPVGDLVDGPDDVVERRRPASTSRIASSSASTSYLPISEAASPSAVCASCSFSTRRVSTRTSPANSSLLGVEQQRRDLRAVLLAVAVDAAVALLDADQAPRDVEVDRARGTARAGSRPRRRRRR